MLSLADPVFVFSFALTLVIELAVAAAYFSAAKAHRKDMARLLAIVLAANLIPFPPVWFALGTFELMNLPSFVAIALSEFIAIILEAACVFLLAKKFASVPLSVEKAIFLSFAMNLASFILGWLVLLAAAPLIRGIFPAAGAASGAATFNPQSEAVLLMKSPAANCMRLGLLSKVFSASPALSALVTQQSQEALEIRDSFAQSRDLLVLERINASVCAADMISLVGCSDACYRGFYTIAAGKGLCQSVSNRLLRMECEEIYGMEAGFENQSYLAKYGSTNLDTAVACMGSQAVYLNNESREACTQQIASVLASG